MNDNNHADTANTLDIADNIQPINTETPIITANPTTATNSSGDTVILTTDGDSMVSKPYTSDASNYSPDGTQ